MFLGPKIKHNTYETEVVGAIMALWLTRNTLETIGKQISLYIDNQAIIMALTGARPSSGQYLINTLRTAANRLPANLRIKWISSHREVKGNKAADKLAKVAVQGWSSRMTELPHILRSPLPLSASVVKQDFSTKLNRL